MLVHDLGVGGSVDLENIANIRDVGFDDAFAVVVLGLAGFVGADEGVVGAVLGSADLDGVVAAAAAELGFGLHGSDLSGV